MSKTTVDIKLSDTITGLTNTSWDRNNVVSGRAATEDQLRTATEFANPMSSMYMDDGKPLTYYIDEEEEVQAYLDRTINARSGSTAYPGVVAKTVTYSTSAYTWTGTPDNDGNEQTTPEALKVRFPDQSTLEKRNVTFSRPYSVPDRVYAVRLGEGATFVDTGLTLNFAYRFEVKGYIEEGIQGSLIGAYSSNSVRTTIRVLGGSNKAQLCWPNIVEVPAANIPCDGDSTFSYRRMCRIVASGKGVPGDYKWRITGTGDVGQECAGSGGGSANWQTAGTDSAKIYLLNEQANSTYRNAILREARIYDENDVLIRMFQGAKRNGEVVIVDAISGDIYRPDAGTLMEVTQ